MLLVTNIPGSRTKVLYCFYHLSVKRLRNRLWQAVFVVQPVSSVLLCRCSFHCFRLLSSSFSMLRTYWKFSTPLRSRVSWQSHKRSTKICKVR